MLIKPNGEELAKKVKNSYELVSVISRRARQLTNGVEAMIKSKSNSKVTIASLEFEKDKYSAIRQNKLDNEK